MRKFYLFSLCLLLVAAGGIFWKLHSGPSVVFVDEDEEEEHEGYDGPAQRDSLEFLKTVDPALGYVPYNRLYDAMVYTNAFKQQLPNLRTQAAMAWEERGPIFDSLGPSNGNGRAGVNYTSGRIAAFLVDTLNDPTGNTVLAGGIAGGLWRCTNFLAQIPNWRPVNDFMGNLAISSVCQDPSRPNVMYMGTGEPTSNADAVLGKGIWKSTNAGLSWTLLDSTVNVIRTFKVACDAVGNVYVGARTTATPAANLAGMLRSTDGGLNWKNITPAALGTATATATCTDLEISSTGKLYASFGYSTGGTTVSFYVTPSPSTVTQSAGWTLGSGIRNSGLVAGRLELAALADTVYGVTTTTAGNTDSCYKSVNGGLTFTKQNTVAMPAGLGNGQGWYDLTLSINPVNSNDLLSGGLDAYRSTNAGATWQRSTYWVTTAPYVHADHHNMMWWNKGGESRILIASDGGLFLSRDDGASYVDKNRNLPIKQFYGGAIHPDAGSPYLIGGAQDNGNHQLKYPGLGPSNEVVGGDGAYVHINQQNPQVQWGAYVYNQYRYSIDGGGTWRSYNPSTTIGMFINPFDMDDAQNIVYACYSANNLLRITGANTTAPANTVVPVTALNGTAAAVKMSPYTPNRVFLSSNGGRVVRVDGANATPTITNITGANLPAAYINCVNTGTDDNNLVATYTTYGAKHVWVTSDGGTTWTNIDGNLPDMPVRWALFDGGRNDRLILATEAGIYTTDFVNGSNTIWAPNTTFPTVRTDMLQMRTSDSTMVAATHGRGLFTSKIAAAVIPQVSFLQSSFATAERTDSTTGCRRYVDYQVGIGLTMPASAATTVTVSTAGSSAVEGVDFDITTTGSFAAPSKQLVFDTGRTVTKYVVVRVYDDREVEATENIVLNFTVAGSNAVAGLLKTYTLTIGDNDAHPTPYQSGNFSLGTYDTDLSASSPFNGTKLRNRLQVLYTAAELRNAGFLQGGPITALKLRVKSKSSTTPFNGFSISMMNTNATTLNSTFFGGATITQVYSANYSTVVGDNNFAFNKPFVWDGSSNLLIQFCYDNFGGTAAAAADVVEGMGTPLGTGIRGSIYSNWTTADQQGCLLAAALVSDNRVNATFTSSFGTVIATALNASGTEYLASRNDIYFYKDSTEVLARITNLGTDNFGCTQVSIDRAGTGASQFWNTNAANYLMNKTYRIVPSTNTPTGKYEVTFFFTKAEKEGWEQATGQSWNNIQIIKLPSAIKNVSPTNAQPDGPGTVEVINAVTRTSGPDFYTLSAVFSSGFSGFGFGIPGRMNTILTLSGALDANGRDIDLTWTTSAEINSTVFQVEKSYDGVTFHSIGTVAASVNKLSPTTYTFKDVENVADNYYRIKMLHSDGYVLYSNVIYIKKDNAPNTVFVTPNPFSNQLTVRFGRTPSGTVVLSLYDASGRLMQRVTRNGGSPSFNMPITVVLAAGTYLLEAKADGQRYSKKISRQ